MLRTPPASARAADDGFTRPCAACAYLPNGTRSSSTAPDALQRRATHAYTSRDAAQQQTDALANYARLARKRYDGGYTSYLEVLDAERSLFNAQLQLSQSQADVLLQATQLYKALGGGWVDLADRAAPQPMNAPAQAPAQTQGPVSSTR